MASLTLTAQIEHSFDAILAIKEIEGVFALVLLGGLVDLKPEPFFCHPGLNPFGSSDLGISDGGNQERLFFHSVLFVLFFFLK